MERDVKELFLKIFLSLGLAGVIAAKSIFVFSNNTYIDIQAITFLLAILAVLLLLSPELKVQKPMATLYSMATSPIRGC